MEIIVQKFGGTSVADLDRIRNVACIIQKELSHGSKVVAVVSAMAGVTNSLITKCNELSLLNEEDSLKEQDVAIASGEIITSALLALQLQTLGIKAKSLQGWQVPITTDKLYGNAQVTKVGSKKIMDLLNKDITPVITGFQGISNEGDITTLGKGGSDTSAAVLAASLKATRCDIYTDVDGIYTADPRVVNNAIKIEKIDIDELYALCAAGAKVLHPRAALAAKRYGFMIRILSSFTNCSGTISKNEKQNMENKVITAITSNKNLLKIIVENQSSDFSSIINFFAKELITIEKTYNFKENSSLIITNLSDKNKCEKLLSNLKMHSIITNYSIEANISSVSIIGYGIKNNVEFISSIINMLNKNSIDILATDISDIQMSLILDDTNNEKVIKLLHDYCF